MNEENQNNIPPEGDNPPAGDENTLEHWQKKYGDGENEKGELRKKLETEKANSEFWQQKAQSVQAPPQAPNNGDDNINLDPMEEDFGKNLAGFIGKTVKGVFQENRNIDLVEQHTQEIITKYNVSRKQAVGILNIGYQNGAHNSEQAVEIFKNNLGNLGSEFIGGKQPPANPNPNPNPNPNNVQYPVTPPTVPTGGDPGAGSDMAKMPSADEWNEMTDDQKRAHRQKVKDGKVQFNSDHATYSQTG